MPDERLVQEIQKGNTDGFAVIFKRYHRLVHVIALNVVRYASETEDLTQTVFLEIYGRLGQFDPARGTLKVWLLLAYSRSMHRRNYLFVRRFHSQVQLSEAEERTSHWSPARLQPPAATRLTDQALAILSELSFQRFDDPRSRMPGGVRFVESHKGMNFSKPRSCERGPDLLQGTGDRSQGTGKSGVNSQKSLRPFSPYRS